MRERLQVKKKRKEKETDPRKEVLGEIEEANRKAGRKA